MIQALSQKRKKSLSIRRLGLGTYSSCTETKFPELARQSNGSNSLPTQAICRSANYAESVTGSAKQIVAKTKERGETNNVKQNRSQQGYEKKAPSY